MDILYQLVSILTRLELSDLKLTLHLVLVERVLGRSFESVTTHFHLNSAVVFVASIGTMTIWPLSKAVSRDL